MAELANVIDSIHKHVKEIEAIASSNGISLDFVLMAVKRQFVVASLARNKNKRAKVAEEFHWHRNTVPRVMAECKIEIKPNVGRNSNARNRPGA